LASVCSCHCDIECEFAVVVAISLRNGSGKESARQRRFEEHLESALLSALADVTVATICTATGGGARHSGKKSYKESVVNARLQRGR
jgi:hypothetical protein